MRGIETNCEFKFIKYNSQPTIFSICMRFPPFYIINLNKILLNFEYFYRYIYNFKGFRTIFSKTDYSSWSKR